MGLDRIRAGESFLCLLAVPELRRVPAGNDGVLFDSFAELDRRRFFLGR